MPIIECRQGNAEVAASGQVYSFNKDRYGRFVATIEDGRALACFLARSDMYREVQPEAPATRVLWPGEVERSDDEEEGEASTKPRQPRKPRAPRTNEQDAPGLDGSQQTGEE